jgi:hypothetical protein
MWTCAASWRSASGPLPVCWTKAVRASTEPDADNENTARLPPV